MVVGGEWKEGKEIEKEWRRENNNRFANLLRFFSKNIPAFLGSPYYGKYFFFQSYGMEACLLSTFGCWKVKVHQHPCITLFVTQAMVIAGGRKCNSFLLLLNGDFGGTSLPLGWWWSNGPDTQSLW